MHETLKQFGERYKYHDSPNSAALSTWISNTFEVVKCKPPPLGKIYKTNSSKGAGYMGFIPL